MLTTDGPSPCRPMSPWAAEVAELARVVESKLGPVAILVNNAGIARSQAVEQITERDWDEVLAVNLKSVFLVTQAVLPGMRAAGWGRSSISRPWPLNSAGWSGRTTRPPRPESTA